MTASRSRLRRRKSRPIKSHALAILAPAQLLAGLTYRPRRPPATRLHELVRTNLDTWLATASERDEYGRGVALHVESALRGYLKCGILAHGFARVYCGNCRHDFLVAFSCKGRDLWASRSPSSTIRRGSKKMEGSDEPPPPAFRQTGRSSWATHNDGVL